MSKAGRGGNRLKPVAAAEGSHSTFKRGKDGNISNYAEYRPNPRNPSGFDEVKRVDLEGSPHTNPDGTIIQTPHVKERGEREKGVRPARQDEIPAPRQPRCEAATGTRIC
ncbi:MAG: polymorphic toxin type 24 domain-containing protein [Gammaproteobacteria bacterium]